MLKAIAASAMILAGAMPAGAAYWSGYGDWIRILKDEAREEAVRVAHEYRYLKSVYVFQVEDGDYVVLTGPFPTGTAGVMLNRLIERGAVPHTSFVHYGPPLVELVSDTMPEPAPSGLPATAYLFDLLEYRDYHAAWRAMLGGADDIPPWVNSRWGTFEGEALESEEVVLNGQRYIVSTACSLADYLGERLGVLYAQDEKRASALLMIDNQPRWFGEPSAEEQAVLRAVVPPLEKPTGPRPRVAIGIR
jgi:hypothetical protein